MTDWDRLCRGTTCAAWAYFFLYFNVNLGTLNILPDFACYVLLWQAIACLEGEERDLRLLRPLCLLLGVWAGLEWAAALLGWSLEGRLLPWDLLLAVAGLYFHFQLFTDFAHLAERYQGEGETLDRRLLRLRTVQALLQTALTASVFLLSPGTELTFPGGSSLEGLAAGVLLALAAAGLVVALMLMFDLFALRRCLRQRAEAAG